ncbi:hypothetical protein MMC13_000603 [Lambiella insularis]|nr:hypothetical protein [Lambiella insularis]
MPLGASITYGYKSSHKNGYRGTLYDLLAKAGNVVNMVGSQHSGTFHDNANEGHPGFTTGEVANVAKKTVPQYKPDVVLILVGTNDAKSKDEKIVTGAPASLGKLIDMVLQDVPDAAVVVSTLPPNADKRVNKNIQAYNAAIPEVVSKRASKGKHVLMVDAHKVVEVKELVDGTHPNDKGYDAIAQVMFDGLKKAAGKKWLNDKPEKISNKLKNYRRTADYLRALERRRALEHRRALEQRGEYLYRAEPYAF